MSVQALLSKANEIKKNIAVLSQAAVHPGTPWYAKLFILLVLAYALSPIDLIPDFIPILGYADDLILIPAGIVLAVRMIPEEIIEECQINVGDNLVPQQLGKWGAGFIALFWIFVIAIFGIYLLQ